MQRQGLVESITLWLLFSAPNLWAYTILRRLWSHLWPSCALMKNSTALCRGQWSLTPFHPEPSNVHLEEFTRPERYWINKQKKRKRDNLGKTGKKALVCPPFLSALPPIFSILVRSKVFAQVLMDRDDLEDHCDGDRLHEGWGGMVWGGGSVYLPEIQAKPKISLEGENVRQPGIRRCSHDPDSCVCDPAAIDSLCASSPRQKSVL